jgi:hypothetical protein
VYDDFVAFYFFKKIGLRILARIVSTTSDSPKERCCAGMSKSRAEIADDVMQFVATVVELDDLVV